MVFSKETNRTMFSDELSPFKIHMLKPYSPVFPNITLFGDKSFKELYKLK